MKAAHDEQQNLRELEHAKWRVSYGEFMIRTHQLLLVKDDDWQRRLKDLEGALERAKGELSRISRA